MSHITIDQTFVQKFLAVPTLCGAAWYVVLFFVFKEHFVSNRSMAYYAFGSSIIQTACVLIGLIIHSKHSDFDPFTTKEITRKDQLLPYYVMNVAKNIPGLSAGIIYEDILSKILKENLSQQSINKILKIISYRKFYKSFSTPFYLQDHALLLHIDRNYV
ncbi:hypothetical protein BDFB_013430, partial [Asbolus verrucosus]